MHQFRHLIRSSIVVIAFVGCNKITGFVKLLLMTRAFGTGADADALSAAIQLPELLQAMLLGGALGAALLPVYSAYLTNGEAAQAQALARTVMTLTLLIAALVSGLTILLAPWLVKTFLVPDFSPRQQLVTTELVRILMIGMGLLSISSVTTTLLNAHQHFWTPAFGTVLIDTGQIFGIYYLAPVWGIEGVAWGSVIGITLLVLVQLPAYLQRGIGFLPQLNLRLKGLYEVLHLMWPRIITLGAYQATDLVFIRLASRLPEGAISAFFFAMLVMVALPKSFFSYTITMVLFPTLAEQYNLGKVKELRRTIAHGLQAVLALLVPSALGLLALGPGAIAFLFERGAFDSESTALVFSLAALLSLRLIGEAVADVLMMPFYAHHNTRVPMLAIIGWALLSVILYFPFVRWWGIYGLTLAGSVAAVMLAVAVMKLKRHLIGPLDRSILLPALGRIMAASAGMCVVILWIRSQIEEQLLLYIVSAIGAGAVTYLVIYLALSGSAFRLRLRHLIFSGEVSEANTHP